MIGRILGFGLFGFFAGPALLVSAAYLFEHPGWPLAIVGMLAAVALVAVAKWVAGNVSRGRRMGTLSSARYAERVDAEARALLRRPSRGMLAGAPTERR